MTNLCSGDFDAEALASYRRDGFLICEYPLFSTEKFDRLRALTREYVERVRAGQLPTDTNVPHFTDPRLFEFLLDEAVLNCVEKFIGEHIAIWSSQFFFKPAQDGVAVPWHSDAYYWHNFIKPVDVLSLFIAVDDASVANGCLRVLRESAGRHDFKYRSAAALGNDFFPLGVDDAQIDESQVVDVELKAGQFLLFDGHLMHGSRANQSDQSRNCFTMRYAPTSCQFSSNGLQPWRSLARKLAGTLRQRLTGRDFYSHQVYLARGKDLANNRYTEFPPNILSCNSGR